MGRRTVSIAKSNPLSPEPLDIRGEGGMFRRHRVGPLVVGHDNENVRFLHAQNLARKVGFCHMNLHPVKVPLCADHTKIDAEPSPCL